jgi:hypothetical protein
MAGFKRVAGMAIAITVGACSIVGAPAARGAEAPLPIADKDVHMGVATCAGSTCHGAVEAWPNAQILQNEYLTWHRQDKHAKAYQVLLNERSRRIARNLGLEAAEKADVCLDCHADNVPQGRRHRTFQIADGVACEACHGGAGRWIGTHIAANATHPRNIENGLYPSADPVQRARLCLSCHFGDGTRFVTHRIMGAGHPRMSFELDTFTAIQPAHFKVDADYRQRKGAWSGVQTWAVGQAMAIATVLDAMVDPKRGRDGAFPELVLFDCHSCHRPMSGLTWAPRASVGLGPGIPRISDSNMLMVRVILEHVDAPLAKTFGQNVLALHKASTEGHAAMVEKAKALKTTADQLARRFANHRFGKDDLRALINGVLAVGDAGEFVVYAAAEQATMALGSLINSLRDLGVVDKKQFEGMNAALDRCYKAVEKDEQYEPKAFLAALGAFKASVPQF